MSADQVGAGQVSAVRYDRDADGVVVLTLDDPDARANTMNVRYRAAMHEAVDRLYAEVDDVTGVIVASAKSTYFAGADLRAFAGEVTDRAALFAEIEGIKADLRRLELYPRPVVAAINGAALGAGLEIALATHHRVAVEGRHDVGLPEVTLGLLPGSGGVTRTVRMLGLQKALMDVLLPGTRFTPARALDAGLVDELVATREELVPAARAWIGAHREDPPGNPWDREGYRMPGGDPRSPRLAAQLPAYPALLRQQSKGADYHAPKAILAAAVEGAQVDVDTALRIESRYLTSLVGTPQSRNMIQAFFLDLQAIRSGALRPADVPPFRPTRVAVLGAGMMGAGIAYVCAKAGLEVVLKDVSLEAAERGAARSRTLLEKAVARGRSTEAAATDVLARITPTAEATDVAGCDLVIEAVPEDPALKRRVYAEVLPHVDPAALLCSNTSTLPITGLADGVDRPEDFVGLHFFSPVDRMPLVEIIRGEKSTDEAVARAYDVVLLLRKTPIVVQDSRGFFTSRVIGRRVNEALAMLGEGVHPITIERAATQAGYPVGPLQLSDELNLELMRRIGRANRAAVEASGAAYGAHPAEAVVETMIGLGRAGRLAGAGFYDYAEGRRGSLWAGLAEAFPVAPEQPPFADVADRMLVAEALEAQACLDEGVVTSTAAANIGSILGIGFPALTGGVAQFVTGYDAADGTAGPEAFWRRAAELGLTPPDPS